MAGSGFEQFVGQSQPALMRHAHALTGEPRAAEDLTPNLGSVVSVSPDGGTTWYAVPPPPA